MSFLTTIPFGSILGGGSAVLFLAAVVIQSVKLINEMSPADRNDWLHRALAVALSIEEIATSGGGAPVASNLVGTVNSYLKLHAINIKVNESQVQLLLAELKPQLEAASRL